MSDILMITGVPGAGKSSLALSLAKQLPRSVVLSGDSLRDLVVGGFTNPSEEWTDEHRLQFLLSFTNEASLAKNFIEKGFKVIIEDVINPQNGLLNEWQKSFTGMNHTRVFLRPSLEILLERNRTRSKNVPESVIRYLYVHMTPEHFPMWHVIDTSHMTLESTVTEVNNFLDW